MEGPFINPEMKGAHKEHLMRQISTKGAEEIEDFYGSLDHVSIITIAPELAGENMESIQQLVKRNIVISIGKFQAIKQVNLPSFLLVLESLSMTYFTVNDK